MKFCLTLKWFEQLRSRHEFVPQFNFTHGRESSSLHLRLRWRVDATQCSLDRDIDTRLWRMACQGAYCWTSYLCRGEEGLLLLLLLFIAPLMIDENKFIEQNEERNAGMAFASPLCRSWYRRPDGSNPCSSGFSTIEYMVCRRRCLEKERER